MKKFGLIIVLFFCCMNVISANNYKIGDKVSYNGANFYVINENSDSYTVIKDMPLTVSDIKNI